MLRLDVSTPLPPRVFLVLVVALRSPVSFVPIFCSSSLALSLSVKARK